MVFYIICMGYGDGDPKTTLVGFVPRVVDFALGLYWDLVLRVDLRIRVGVPPILARG